MVVEVASRQAVVFGTDDFSQAVSMQGGNAVQLSAVLFVKGGGNVTVTIQGSNDLENWSTTNVTGSAITFTAVGFSTAQFTGIAWAYIRVKFSQATSGTGIISATVNISQL